ncbi:ImmA/IrrE family metallo-endopeptidase [Kordiimonas sp. SCSIO 12603]|uniref:ImmA/IrrE family metallo-endopeptidase n=1 Tax=Kordiimonas sp. SCSIO 12603 TaxID=2829596 RepID=UPI0021054231|nr:ImmA/IrrE family metallo-endopeptidase [Kordiimonas sp. SCSIO 12603]UTW59040.1 ImmA/IrrE family metallo-endopeptidase [Kordiimonas sp. SCSIO 12603]
MTMLEPEIGEFESKDIREHVNRLLRDLGWPEPPIKLEEARAIQKLDLTYYSKTDLNLLDEIAHKTKLAGATILGTARKMTEVVEKAGLRGLLLLKENDKKIFIDDEVVQLKRRFLIAHEISHDLLPWHRSLLMGDNEHTLNPGCHQMMEAEANYTARKLIFHGDLFQREALDCKFSWNSIKALKHRYGNTYTTTLWHMVCERDPDHPAFGLIGKHPYHSDIGSRKSNSNVAYFPRSKAFRERFSHVSSEDLFNVISTYASRNKKGPIGETELILTDLNGESCVFYMYSFSNGYDLLTFGYFLELHKSLVGFEG